MSERENNKREVFDCEYGQPAFQLTSFRLSFTFDTASIGEYLVWRIWHQIYFH